MNEKTEKTKHIELEKFFKPVATFVIIVVSVSVVTWFLSPILFGLFPEGKIKELSAGLYVLTLGSHGYILHWTIWIIPVFLVLNLLLLFLDLVFKGSLLSKIIGRFFTWAVPSFGLALEQLGRWYENPETKKSEYSHKFEFPEDFDLRHAFANWMAFDINPRYENNVQAMTYIGAAILIGLIGLRGINFIQKNEPTLILIGLELEFTLLLLLGFVLFFKPEEHPQRELPPEGFIPKAEYEKVKAELENHRGAIADLVEKVTEHSKRLGLKV